MIYINGRFLTHKIAGIPRFSYEMCLAMKSIGIYFTVVAPRYAPRKEYPFPVEYYGNKKTHLWEQVDLYRFVKKKNNALLISFSGLGPALYKNHLPTIHDLSFWNHPEWFSFFYRLLYKILTPILAKNALKVITVSQFSKSEIIKYLKIEEQKVILVPNAVSNDLRFQAERNYFPNQNKSEEKYVLMVSARDPRKNFLRAVEAFLSLQLENVKLYIVGDSGTVFKDKGMNYFNHPSVILLGRVSDKLLSLYYKKALLFVYPSLYEGFGIPPLEAMANACPVLVSDIPPIREVCGEAAFYCNPEDVNSIAEGIRTVIDDKKLRNSLIEKGMDCESNYTWEASAKKMKDLLEQLSRNEKLVTK